MKRLENKIKNLKKGDIVVIYGEYDTRLKPEETTVERKGSKIIRAGRTNFEMTGYGDYGWYLFPGTMEEFNHWQETKNFAKSLLDRLKQDIYDLTMDELNVIDNIIKNE